jgi:hypothetical protein
MFDNIRAVPWERPQTHSLKGHQTFFFYNILNFTLIKYMRKIIVLLLFWTITNFSEQILSIISQPNIVIPNYFVL